MKSVIIGDSHIEVTYEKDEMDISKWHMVIPKVKAVELRRILDEGITACETKKNETH